MNVQEVRAARKAQQEIVEYRVKLEAVKSRPAMPAYAVYWSEYTQEYFLEKHAREIKTWEDRIQERQEIFINPVLQWAAEQPEDIQKIIQLRILDLLEWPEISRKVCNSSTGNTAYMRLRRVLESSEAGKAAE